MEKSNNSFFSRFFAFIFIVFLIPIFFILYLLVKLTSKGPFLFKQKRLGKNKKIFTIYKVRTMIENANELQKKYMHLNQAHGPAFKIRNDPRYTAIGKLLSHTGLDELPQLFNVLRGDMALVGPRPLPVEEAKKVPQKYSKRFSVLPGMTSPWVVAGSHKLSFEKWMELDTEYVSKRNIKSDLSVVIKTIGLVLRSCFAVIVRQP